MKYLFINTVCFGSTGRIIEGLGKTLIAQGHECTLAFGRGKKFESFNCIKIGSRLSSLFHALITRLFDKQGHGSFIATRKLIKFIKEYNPDVIWLHNIHGYYLNVKSLFTFLKKQKVIIKWTLHDCWPVTGHCCYFTDAKCEKWKTLCEKCPQRLSYPKSLTSCAKNNYLEKKQLFTSVMFDRIIVPSEWMANIVKNSFLKNNNIMVENNDVDHSIFYTRPKGFLFKKIQNQRKVLLGVANVWEKRKGLARFIELSKTIDKTKYCIVLIGLSKKQIKRIPSSIYAYERMDVKNLANAYISSDVYINLSTEETFGMTTLEALSCGVPSIVLKGTACEEVALKFSNGYAVNNEISEIYRKIQEITNYE